MGEPFGDFFPEKRIESIHFTFAPPGGSGSSSKSTLAAQTSVEPPRRHCGHCCSSGGNGGGGTTKELGEATSVPIREPRAEWILETERTALQSLELQWSFGSLQIAPSVAKAPMAAAAGCCSGERSRSHCGGKLQCRSPRTSPPRRPPLQPATAPIAPPAS